MRRLVLSFLLVTVLGAAPALARTTLPEQPVDAFITGTLLTTSAAPAASLCITAVADEAAFPHGWRIGFDGTTDSTGRFSIQVSAREHHAAIRYALAFDTCNADVPVAPEIYKHLDVDLHYGWNAVPHLFVAAHRTASIGAWRLRPEAIISGNVRLALGKPMRGACVELAGGPPHESSNLTMVGVDKNGHYRFRQLVPGPYRLTLHDNCTLYYQLREQGSDDSVLGTTTYDVTVRIGEHKTLDMTF